MRKILALKQGIDPKQTRVTNEPDFCQFDTHFGINFGPKTGINKNRSELGVQDAPDANKKRM